MVSFDVESLFTNIPLEAIDLAIQAIHYIGVDKHDLKLTKPNLKQLFWLVTAQTRVSFNGNFYDQITGVALGSPLATILTNLFMGHHERIWFEQYNGPNGYFLPQIC